MNKKEEEKASLNALHSGSQKQKSKAKVKAGDNTYPTDYDGLLHQFRAHEFILAERNQEVGRMSAALAA